jgi:hypothetical protein
LFHKKKEKLKKILHKKIWRILWKSFLYFLQVTKEEKF